MSPFFEHDGITTTDMKTNTYLICHGAGRHKEGRFLTEFIRDRRLERLDRGIVPEDVVVIAHHIIVVRDWSLVVVVRAGLTPPRTCGVCRFRAAAAVASVVPRTRGRRAAARDSAVAATIETARSRPRTHIKFKWLLLLADFQSCFAVARPAVTSRGGQL